MKFFVAVGSIMFAFGVVVADPFLVICSLLTLCSVGVDALVQRYKAIKVPA